jgi:hypothetical protein
MNIISKLRIVAAGAALAAATSAFALTITPGSAFGITGANNSNLDAAGIASALGLGAGSLVELYKSDVGDPDEGTFATSYTTTYTNTPSDPEDALIDNVAAPSINSVAKYLYIKDGNHQPAYYIFNIGVTGLNWNGTDDIVLDGFWPSNGAISHVAIYGGTGPGGDIPGTPGVPDGGQTVALLGLALAAIGIVRRKLN